MAATAGGEESLEVLSSAFPPLYLSPSPELSLHARAASRHLFSSLLPFVPPKHQKLDRLLAEEGFDAEQIWAQIDLLARPLLPALRKELGRIAELGPSRPPPVVETIDEEKVGEDEEEEEEVNEDGRDDDNQEEDEDEEHDDDDDDDDGEEGEEKGYEGVEDRFLKMEELEKYMEDGEAREYGGSTGKGKKKDDEDEDDESEGEDEKEDIDLEFGHLGSGDDEESAENARYSDYFKSNKVRGSKKYDHEKKNKASKEELEFHSGSEELEMEDEEKDDSDVDIQDNGTHSTHEKQLLRIQSKVEQMEKENLEPKSWFMQGEVTAAKRPKDSLLVMDLDFEHNVKPPPVDTQEMLASLEDLMKKRIIEGQFDDVQRAPASLSKPPKELKELDESKSKKGLAELYEEDYSQKTGLVSAPLSFSDEQKKEATILFKALCTKLDALAHFHYAPKPVIEDMAIQANVPALAMEEIAPLAVSDAAMLAPEEVFKGKGDVKEETELTQEDRKRRRANKKRKFKAETAKREAKKLRQNAALTPFNGKEDLS